MAVLDGRLVALKRFRILADVDVLWFLPTFGVLLLRLERFVDIELTCYGTALGHSSCLKRFRGIFLRDLRLLGHT